MCKLKTLLYFATFAIAVAAVWVAAYRAIFPIEPALYSLTGFLSL